jgi:hypothetical protein
MRKWALRQAQGPGKIGKWEKVKPSAYKCTQVNPNAKSDIRNHLGTLSSFVFIWVHFFSFGFTWVHLFPFGFIF